MADKEIIIDGAYISGCEFLWKERLPRKVCNNGNLDCDCNSNPNCYYKQLKHKEQALDEIENITKGYCKNMCIAEDREVWESCQSTEILDIINKTKGETNEES